MKQAHLPTDFRPFTTDHLVRLGRANDGGYLVDSRDIDAADCLVSLGINRDWSFEKDFLERNDVPLFAFDASVGPAVYAKDLIKGAVQIYNPRKIINAASVFVDYFLFFRNRRRHIKQYVGIDFPPTFVDMIYLFDLISNAGCHRPFFKIDIEGFEYRLLEQLIVQGDIVSGLVIEFHDCDLQKSIISEFIKNAPFTLAHIHANNFSPTNKDKIPLALELTFSSQTDGIATSGLPHALDMVNNPKLEDYILSFSD